MTGIFWNINSVLKAKKRKIPPIPSNNWKPPRDLPRLSDAKLLAIDVETYDPGLIKRGPGWARGEGHIVGVSIGADNDGRWYLPVRHTVGCSLNLKPEKVFNWLKKELSTNTPKVGANLLYDVGWLSEEGIDVKGQLYDVQFAEALLSEQDPVALDALGKKYLGLGKESNTLYQWCSEAFGGQPNGKQRANIHRTPPQLVGPYAESDVDIPLRLMPVLYKKLKAENLWDLFIMENKLIPLLVKMRQRGVRIDLEAADKLSDKLKQQQLKKQKELNWTAKQSVDVYASKSIASAFDRNGLAYEKTEKGNPSFTKNFLTFSSSNIAKLIVEIRELDKLRNTFIQNAIINHSVNGRIHCQFHPLRSDASGTRSGRLSASDPNLQQVPYRTALGREIRKLFIPYNKGWRKQDQSQVEYRMLVNFAVGDGSDEARHLYCTKPNTDYHSMTIDLIKKLTGMTLDRSPAKTINFGLVYGMSEFRLGNNLNLANDEAKKLFEAYHTSVPFAKETMEWCMNFAKNNGFIDTILGRKSRFNLYEPINWRDYFEARPKPLPYDKALKTYGSEIIRAMLHKALNRKLQGSAADILKAGMLKCYEDGLFNSVGVPLLTVHDELDFDDPGDCDNVFKEIRHTCETVLDLRVPLKVDEEIGSSWGNLK